MKLNIGSLTKYFFGLILMGLGIALYIKANLGIGSWDVLHKNLTDYYGLSIGWWVFIVGSVVIIISLLIQFNKFAILAVITSLLFGQIIDFWLIHVFKFNVTSLALAIPFYTVGLVLLGSGISLLVLSSLPPTPPDVLMMSLANRFNMNFLLAKTLTEVSVFVLAILIGYINNNVFNNVGVGTFISLLLIGSIVQLSTTLWKKILF